MATRYTYPNKATRHGLKQVMQKVLQPGKGIFVTDECSHTIGKHFKQVGVKNTDQNRRDYRQMLLCLDGQQQHMISGVVLHPETVNQQVDCGMSFPQYLINSNIVPGVRLDGDGTRIYGTENEILADGVDNLEERLSMYRQMGIEFVTFRIPVSVGKYTPSIQAMQQNANNMAHVASVSQANCMVPVIRPIVGSHGQHDIKGSQKVTETFLAYIIKALIDRHVSMQHIILNPSMVIPGKQCQDKSCSSQAIAGRTISTLQQVVPPAVPGILCSSHGLKAPHAQQILNNISIHKGVKPWIISHGFGGAIQQQPLQIWAGNQKNVKKAQKILLKHLKASSEAAVGKYKRSAAKGTASDIEDFTKCHHH